MTASCVFITFWLRCHNLLFSSARVDFRAHSEKISAELPLWSAENPRFQSKENRRWTALIQSCLSLKQRCSALISAEIYQLRTALIQRKSELIRADVFHVFWISAEQRWEMSSLSNSAVQHWISEGLQPGCTSVIFYMYRYWIIISSMWLTRVEVSEMIVSWRSSGPEFCVVWLLKMPASGRGLLWESSSFVPWLILKTFRDVSGAIPEWPWISGFIRKSSSRPSAPSMLFSVLLKSCDNFLVTLP